jgi:hypothetical protein
MASPAAALKVIRQTVDIDWPAMSQKEAQAFLVQTAKAGHAKIMAEQSQRSGVVPSWTAFGDNPGTPIEQAKQKIVYHYAYLREIILVLIKALEDASPVASGAYRRAHTLYINGRAAPASTPIKPGEEVMIANPLPYARRLEVGKTEAGRDFLVSVPNHIYERITAAAIARYRNAVKISFGYVTPNDAHILQGRLGSHYRGSGGRRRRRRQRAGEAVRAPAIFIGTL